MITIDNLSQNDIPYRAGYMVNASGTAVAGRVKEGADARYRTVQLERFIDFTAQVDAPVGSPAPITKQVTHGLGSIPYIILAVEVEGEFVTIPGNFGANELIFSNARNVTEKAFEVDITNTTAFDYFLNLRAFIFRTPLLK